MSARTITKRVDTGDDEEENTEESKFKSIIIFP